MCIAVAAVFAFPTGAVAQVRTVKLSVFNFGALNIDASSYSTMVTNYLISSFRGNPALSVLDRKELESFLFLNDLQQNDATENVIHIGSRLALDFVVAGTVEKTGSAITVRCNLFSVSQKRVLQSFLIRAYGDAELMSETFKLGEQIAKLLSKEAENRKGESSGLPSPPVNIEARPGNMSVYLRWEDTPGERPAGYKVYRSLSESGPFVQIAQIPQREYLDQGLEKKTTYYYRLKSFYHSGVQSSESPVVKVETVPTPLAPIILKAEGHVKSVALTWCVNPRKSDDPSSLKGFKVYRAESADGPYTDTHRVTLEDIGITSPDNVSAEVKLAVKCPVDGKEYFFKVTAYNENNIESNFSEPVRASSSPGVQKISAQGGLIREVRLSWVAVDAPFVKGYWIYRSVGDEVDFVRLRKVEVPYSTGTISYSDVEGLADDTRYNYRVTAFEDSQTETDPSPVVSAVTKGKPPVPRDVKVISGLARRVQVVWTPNTEDDVEGYKLYRSKTKDGRFEFVKKIPGRYSQGVVDDGGLFGKLEDQVEYNYILRTYNKVDVESDDSPVVSAMTKAKPQKPTGLKWETQGKKVIITWSKSPEPDIVMYRVYEKMPSGVKEIGRVKDTGFSVDVPSNGTSKRYVVTAVDKDDIESEQSDEVTVEK
jgi:fibronectin type 3 domain-containing protein/TolB-like protein